MNKKKVVESKSKIMSYQDIKAEFKTELFPDTKRVKLKSLVGEKIVLKAIEFLESRNNGKYNNPLTHFAVILLDKNRSTISSHTALSEKLQIIKNKNYFPLLVKIVKKKGGNGSYYDFE